MKRLKIIPVLLICLSPLSAKADYIGRFAKYVTTVKSQNASDEVKVGESTLRVTGIDQATQKYTVELTNSDAQGTPTVSTELFNATELDGQMQGTIFNHCVDNYGTAAMTIMIKGNSFQSCVISTANTKMYVGLVPFSILKSVSSGGGKIYTTTLVDYQI